MKNTRKLIPALAMLLISAVMMSTASFAWFTINKTVTASGMKVTARAEGGIQIARPGSEAGVGVSSAIGSITSLLPTSTYDAQHWAHAEGTADDNGAGLVGSYEELTLTSSSPSTSGLGLLYNTNSSNAYVLYDTYTITPDENSSGFTNLWLSACYVEGNNNDLSKSLRVAVVCGDKIIICAPISGASLSYKYMNGVVDGEGASLAKDVTAISTYNTNLYPLASNENYRLTATDTSVDSATVSVYIYFEGEDVSHTTQNLNIGVDTLTISCKFSCDSVQAAE